MGMNQEDEKKERYLYEVRRLLVTKFGYNHVGHLTWDDPDGQDFYYSCVARHLSPQSAAKDYEKTMRRVLGKPINEAEIRWWRGRIWRWVVRTLIVMGSLCVVAFIVWHMYI